MQTGRSVDIAGLGVPPSTLTGRRSLWIHGAAMTGATWHSLRTDLPAAIAPDLPGRGNEPALPGPSVESYADVIERHLDSGSVVIGHSLGGMVALELAARWPERVSALVLIEAVATVRESAVLRALPWFLGPILKTVPPRLFLRLAGLPESQHVRHEMMRHADRLTGQTLRDDMIAAAAYDGRRHLAGLRCPTCVVVATGNTATHRGAQLLAETIPNAIYRAVEGGHLLHVDNPHGVRSTIEGFLRAQVGGSIPRSS
jgi:pimeloyl-ACP methyl ester carboxylesterase